MEKAIGALWEKEGAKGLYMTGNILINEEQYQIVVFRNDRKEGKQPDWRIFKSKPRNATNEMDAF